MTSLPTDVPGVSESGNTASGVPNVKGAKVAHVVSRRNGSADDAQ